MHPIATKLDASPSVIVVYPSEQKVVFKYPDRTVVLKLVMQGDNWTLIQTDRDINMSLPFATVEAADAHRADIMGTAISRYFEASSAA